MVAASEMPKGRLFVALTALFLSSMCTMGDLVISPIAANLYEVFADAPEALVNFGITGPALVGLPFGILAGFLCDRFDKKWVMVMGFAIFAVSACLGAVENIYLFVVLRCLATGVGWGITNTAALSILADLYTDADEHSKYVGWYNSAMSVLGSIMAAVSGVLAVSAWQDAFYAYVLSIPVLILLVIFLPSLPADHHTESLQGESDRLAVRPGWWKSLIPLVVQVFFVAICYYVLLYMGALYATDAQVGDQAFIGMMSSVATIASAVGSLVFGLAYKRMKKLVYLPSLVVMGVCYLAMSAVQTPVVTMACVAICGFAWPFYFCFFYVHCTELVAPSKAGTATSFVAFANGLAATGSSYLLTGLVGFTGGNAVTVWPVFGVAFLVIAAVSLVAVVLYGKRQRA